MSVIAGIRALLFRRPGRDNGLIVTGIIDWMGPSASSGVHGTPWTGSITLIVWREGAGPVQTKALRIEQSLGIGDQGSKVWMKRFSAKETVRLALAGPIEQTAMGCRAQLADKLLANEDSELRNLAEPMLNPPPFDHPLLGRFIPHPRMPLLYEKVVDWLGQPLDLVLSIENADDLPDCSAAAATLLGAAAHWQQAAEVMIVDRLYDVWIDEWREEGEPILDETGFLARLTRSALTVYSSGDFEFEFEDGGLFLNHIVIATGNIADGFDDAGIAG